MCPALAVADSPSRPERAALSTASTASADRRMAALGKKGSSERGSKPKVSISRAVACKTPSRVQYS